MVKISIKRFKKAVHDSMGSITVIAKNLECERGTVYAFLQKHPEQQMVIQDEQDRIGDMVENNMKALALKKDFKAMKLYLERKRGWEHKQHIEMKSKNETKIDLSEFAEYAKEEDESDSKTGDTESSKEKRREVPGPA